MLFRSLAGQVERLRREDGAVGRAALLKERRRIANDRPRKIGRDVSHCSERNKVSNPATRCNSNDSGGGSKPKDAQSTESTGCQRMMDRIAMDGRMDSRIQQRHSVRPTPSNVKKQGPTGAERRSTTGCARHTACAAAQHVPTPKQRSDARVRLRGCRASIDQIRPHPMAISTLHHSSHT